MTAITTNRAEFLFAGKAEFTLQSKESLAHFTYKLTASKDGQMFFVALLGQDGKQYAGCIPADKRTEFRTTRRSLIRRDHRAIVALEWFLKHLDSPQVEVHHCGRCGRCGRKLTNPESITRGIGPECAGKATSTARAAVAPVQGSEPPPNYQTEADAESRAAWDAHDRLHGAA